MASVRKRQRDLAYTKFVEAHWLALHRTAFLLTGDHQRAEDVVQAALVKVYVAWPKVVTMTHPAAHARTVMVHQLTSWWRPRSSRQRPATTLPEEAVPSFDERVAKARAVWSHVLTLPPRQRAVIVLRYYEDRTEAEIAEILGISPGSVKTHTHHAMARLRERMGMEISRRELDREEQR